MAIVNLIILNHLLLVQNFDLDLDFHDIKCCILDCKEAYLISIRVTAGACYNLGFIVC